MGLHQRPKAERVEFVTSIFPDLAMARQRAGSRRRRRQMVAMGGFTMDPQVLPPDEPSAGLSPVRQDEAFIGSRRSTGRGDLHHGRAERAALPADLRPRLRLDHGRDVTRARGASR